MSRKILPDAKAWEQPQAFCFRRLSRALQYRQMRHTWLLATVFVTLLTSIANSQESVTISSDPEDSSRPVSTLLDKLRHREKISVTYEDPRYVNSNDIHDVTAKVARNSSGEEKQLSHRTLIPQGRAISFVYSPVDLRTDEGAEATIARMLREYRMLGGPTFGIVRDSSRFHVVPIDVLDPAGNRAKQGSILSTVISIPAAPRDGGELLEAICEEVKKQTGYEIWIGPNAPGNSLAKYKTAEGVEGETAETAIEHLLDKLALPNSFDWDLYYDPGQKAYALNFDYIGPAGAVHAAAPENR